MLSDVLTNAHYQTLYLHLGLGLGLAVWLMVIGGCCCFIIIYLCLIDFMDGKLIILIIRIYNVK